MTEATTLVEQRESSDIALVFLHYFGGAGQSWTRVVDALPAGTCCITADLCGFGQSHCPDRPMSVDDYADEVCGSIEFLAYKRYVLIGHSMGGKIALALAARKPPGLQSLVLLAPSPPSPEPMDESARKELLAMFGDRKKIEAHLRNICAQPLPPSVLEEEIAQHLRATRTAWNAWLDAGSKEDFSHRMGHIRAPVLVLGGAADTSFTPDFLMREVVERLSGATLQIISGAGHLLPLEQPVQVAAAIRAWCCL